MFRFTSLLTAILLTGACADPGTVEPEVEGPRLASLSTEAGTELVDREAALSGAVEFEAAAEGSLLAMDGTGYRMQLNGDAITGEGSNNRTNNNVIAGAAAVVVADLVTVAVLAPPGIGIGIAAEGVIEQLAPNVWQATNTVQLDNQNVTAQLTVAWVGVGWISEMRISNDTITNQLWFNGFVSSNQALGWWDIYDGETKAGVVEWLSNGVDGEFGYGALVGDNAGDVVVYSSVSGTNRIDFYDAGPDEHAWVQAHADESGSVRLPDFNGGLEGCWDATLEDVPCPE